MGFDNIFNPQYWAVVPFPFWSLVFFSFGCIVGSFLNVCIYRMPLDLSVVSPPSHCPQCEARLMPLDLVPVVSWVVLRGKWILENILAAAPPALQIFDSILPQCAAADMALAAWQM